MMAKQQAITLLQCGCFFVGRKFVENAQCTIHNDKTTTAHCSNCGEFVQSL